MPPLKPNKNEVINKIINYISEAFIFMHVQSEVRLIFCFYEDDFHTVTKELHIFEAFEYTYERIITYFEI